MKIKKYDPSKVSKEDADAIARLNKKAKRGELKYKKIGTAKVSQESINAVEAMLKRAGYEKKMYKGQMLWQKTMSERASLLMHYCMKKYIALLKKKNLKKDQESWDRSISYAEAMVFKKLGPEKKPCKS